MRSQDAALMTDLYELTMMQGYWAHGRSAEQASFELFFRKVPEGGGYCVAAGIDDALELMAKTRFTEPQLQYLASLDTFQPGFLEFLRSLQFTGEVRAVAEGSLVFPNEPIVEVCGSLIESQWFESLLLNIINFQTLIATKASRIVRTAWPATVIEFGLRRAQGPNGGLWAAKAAYVGGCIGTSNVDAGFRFGIPVFGTHAHSWVMSFPTESDAFRAYGEVFPDKSILLIDTYDTLGQGLPNAIAEAKRLESAGHRLFGVRLDSGDLAEQSKVCRQQFDEAGLDYVQIVASSEIDEYALEALNARGAPIDIYGVGTRLATAFDEPALGGVYKLNALNIDGQWQPKMKIASDPIKTTIPGRKQIWRRQSAGYYRGDILSRRGEDPPTRVYPASGNGTPTELDPVELHPILEPRIEAGRLVGSPRPLTEIRDHVADELKKLPPEHLRLSEPETYTVGLSETLHDFRREMIERLS